MADPKTEGTPNGLTEREAEIYRLHAVNRLTQREIGERVGISQQRVGVILADARAKMPQPDLAGIRAEAMARHLAVIREAAALMERNGAPVTAGKDGVVVHDPEDNSVVRDYSGRVAAAKLILEADRELRKLTGADAATKSEITAGVKYEVVGVDPKDLI